jgi:hypothetical protein
MGGCQLRSWKTDMRSEISSALDGVQMNKTVELGGPRASALEGKATPGPWTYDPRSGWIISEDCCHRGIFHVADIRGWGHLTGHGHGAHAMSFADAKAIQDANARLICAAHHMAEALRWIAEVADKEYEGDVKLRSQGARTLIRISDKARAAFLKTTSLQASFAGGPSPTFDGGPK